jgi:hypothetical protein
MWKSMATSKKASFDAGCSSLVRIALRDDIHHHRHARSGASKPPVVNRPGRVIRIAKSEAMAYSMYVPAKMGAASLTKMLGTTVCE